MANPRPIVSPSATPRGRPDELPSAGGQGGAAGEGTDATGVIASSLDILFSCEYTSQSVVASSL